MSMTLEQIEAEAVKLPEASRTKLLTHLMAYLEKSVIENDDTASTWTEEAIRRDRAMDADASQIVNTEEVLQKIHLKDRDNEEGFI